MKNNYIHNKESIDSLYYIKNILNTFTQEDFKNILKSYKKLDESSLKDEDFTNFKEINFFLSLIITYLNNKFIIEKKYKDIYFEKTLINDINNIDNWIFASKNLINSCNKQLGIISVLLMFDTKTFNKILNLIIFIVRKNNITLSEQDLNFINSNIYKEMRKKILNVITNEN